MVVFHFGYSTDLSVIPGIRQVLIKGNPVELRPELASYFNWLSDSNLVFQSSLAIINLLVYLSDRFLICKLFLSEISHFLLTPTLGDTYDYCPQFVADEERLQEVK